MRNMMTTSITVWCHRLWDRDDVLLSPHIAGLTDKASERMALACIENAINYLKGTINPNLIVNREALI